MPSAVLAKHAGPLALPNLDVEASVRANFFRAGAESSGAAAGSREEALVNETASFLELLLAGSIAHEVAAAPGGFLTPDQEGEEELVRLIEAWVGRSLIAILSDAVRYLRIDVSKSGAKDWLPLTTVTRRVRSVLDACPIDEIEQCAATLGLEDWGHRARVAFDGLQAFLFRTDERCVEQLRIAGSAYARGHISVDEVATLLAVHPVDALAMLDQGGFHRSLELIEMGDDASAKVYERMRADRLSRPRAFEPSAEMVARDVVASERIEGVDARRWIPREGL